MRPPAGRGRNGRSATISTTRESLFVSPRTQAVPLRQNKQMANIRLARRVSTEQDSQGCSPLFGGGSHDAAIGVRKITLPNDSKLLRRPFLPFAHDGANGFARRWKAEQCMQMIRHQQKKMWPPNVLLTSMLHCSEEVLCYVEQRKLIPESLFAVDGDEVNLPVRIHPKRNVMRQTSWTRLHGAKVSPTWNRASFGGETRQ